MRTFSVIFLSLICLFTCRAQVLVSESKLWSTIESGTDNPESANYHSYWIKFEGDSIINQTLYKKMYRADDSLHTIWTSYGFMREDSSKKVYAYGVPKTFFSAGEELIYDFNIKKGDSIKIADANYFLVDSVNHITLNNQPSIIVYLGNTSFEYSQGIGSFGGILWGFNTMFATGINAFLLCCLENDSIIYHNQNYNSCYVNHIANIIDIKNNKEIKLAISNNGDGVFLILPDNISFPVNISLYNIGGQIVFKGTYNTPRVNLSRINLSPGLYIYEVFIEAQRYCGKVIL